uniref:phosphoenolpyruvate carboxylase n=1 Tax=Odontella aurita TaxID=265563 RepID=A0A7S4JAQ3_9STRA
MLAEVVRRDSPHVQDLYTQLRKHGMDRATDPNNSKSFKKMQKIAYDLSPQDTLGVMRIFSLALNLVNAAEVHHRLRVMREHELASAAEHVGPLPMTDDSVRGTVDAIIEAGDGTADEIFKKLSTQKVEIVLTAHPTEVNRKTLLRKYRKVAETLGVLDRSDLHPYEREEAQTTLKRLIAAIWGSDEIRRQKPTPQQEAAGGNAVIESVLWDAVPAYLRKLDAQCRVSLGKPLPVDCNPIKFGSWIGGDRDGNPNVTPEVTREVVAHQRLRAARLLLGDLNELYNELAISSRFSPEMEELAASVTESFDKIEKYRRVVGHLRKRLVKTMNTCEAVLQGLNRGTTTNSEFSGSSDRNLGNWEDVEPITKSEELIEPLRVMHNSLISTGFGLVADGRLSDILRRLSVFGMTLVPLDIREESTRHTLTMDALTRYLGVGSYKEWDEEARINFLQSELTNKRPMFRTRDMEQNIMGFDDDVLKTLRTFQAASELGPESLGAYVISQAQTASDVLAVMLLQKQFGMTPENGNMMRVVPLFETLNDLTNAPVVLNTLFGVTGYLGAVKGKQEVMVGYSDSAKDAGRLAACWAQYTAQESMAKVAEENNIELTFFHGKGGTVGRGGNPALYRAILSHPPNTINGRFRVTEQGEMITQNFGSPAIAERSLDIYTAAVLREAFTKHVEPTDSWRQQMQRISDVSCEAYRQLVREEPRFVPYFRQATPELELGQLLNIGSRPAKRNPKGGIESLRAIPWTFAWTQTRLHLSAWLGVGEGLSAEDEKDQAELKEMYQNWPWFRETIDLVSMILSKTDFSISENYDHLLVDKKEHLNKLGDEVRAKMVKTRQAVLDVTGSEDFAGPHVQLLRASTKIRNPYVDSINCVQAELLKEIRGMPGDDDEKNTPELQEIKNVRKDALVVSISGIAQGMRNSG